ncbi:MAG: glutamine synthetase family protein [Bacteroides sp.]|nr:glutamine synthetase family protein [Prevotella sp.]MCM1407624.1 glutamine synthetase family protein [Treponema brennaborense]MCM1469226.1 glutamine synthetase family protein [Bacteroides sp.]
MKYTQKEVLRFIAENDVKFVKLMFTDIFGAVRTISIMPDELPRAFASGISFDASAVSGFMRTNKSDLFLIPDPSTLAVLPWRPQHGRVVRFYCNIMYPDGTPFEGDCRLLLQNTEKKVAASGFSCNIGTECEFYLFETDEKGESTGRPHDSAGYCDAAPLDRGENVRRDICLTLEEMGIKPETSHHEAGPGQHEIDFKYSDIISSADNLATFKMVVQTIAARNGLYGSFDPKPFDEESGSGLHVNLSLYKNTENLFDAKKDVREFAPEAEYFLAGILRRAGEMTAFLNPTVQSYKRFGCCEAPCYVSWSRQNRSQLVRIPSASGIYSRMEIRSPDPSCNQYIALSLIINAGLEGIAEKLPLPAALDISIDETPASLLPKNLEPLPRSLECALERAESSRFVKESLPEKIISEFINAKRTEIKKMQTDGCARKFESASGIC